MHLPVYVLHLAMMQGKLTTGPIMYGLKYSLRSMIDGSILTHVSHYLMNHSPTKKVGANSWRTSSPSQAKKSLMCQQDMWLIRWWIGWGETKLMRSGWLRWSRIEENQCGRCKDQNRHKFSDCVIKKNTKNCFKEVKETQMVCYQGNLDLLSGEAAEEKWVVAKVPWIWWLGIKISRRCKASMKRFLNQLKTILPSLLHLSNNSNSSRSNLSHLWVNQLPNQQ